MEKQSDVFAPADQMIYLNSELACVPATEKIEVEELIVSQSSALDKALGHLAAQFLYDLHFDIKNSQLYSILMDQVQSTKLLAQFTVVREKFASRFQSLDN